MQRYRALAVVLTAVLLSAAFIATILSTTVAPSTTTTEPVIGRREVVRVTSLDGESVELRATVDTGAARSSIDEDVAALLGIDLDDAETITIRSAVGKEVREVVPVTIGLAGTQNTVSVSVNDRSELTDPVLLGRDVLEGFLVTTSQTDLTTPDTEASPSAFQAMSTVQGSAVTPGHLLAMMPLAALAIVVLKYVIGLGTLGTFTPVLLTMGFLQSGLVPSLVLTLGVVTLGVALQPVMRRLHIPRVARMGALIGVAATASVVLESSVGAVTGADSWGAAFPMVVAAGLVERIYEVWTSDGMRDALVDAGWTLVVATAVTPLLLAPPVRLLADRAPWALALGATVLSLVVGSYRGLRLTELLRFRHTAVGAA